jgi:pimeloyl-ACP methyl ester carboxylesterase
VFVSAEAQVRRLAETNGPVTLLAHCFGARIAVELLKRVPEKIERVVLLGPAIDPLASLARLIGGKIADAWASAGQSNAATEVRELAARVVRERDVSAFWRMLEQFASRPDSFAHYWGNLEALNRYVTLIERTGPPIDNSAFGSILSSFIAAEPVPRLPDLSRHARDIECVICVGELDAMSDFEAIRGSWGRAIPQARFVRVPGAGHFVHLEGDPGYWASSFCRP